MSGFTPTNHEARLARNARLNHCDWRRWAEQNPGGEWVFKADGPRHDTIWALSHGQHERRASS